MNGQVNGIASSKVNGITKPSNTNHDFLSFLLEARDRMSHDLDHVKCTYDVIVEVLIETKLTFEV